MSVKIKKKIVITGGSGRFGNFLKIYSSKYDLFFPSKKELDILNEKKIKSYLNKKKPAVVIHLAGLSRPMKIHEKEIRRSIDLNIIGTANITKACSINNIKLIYFSTNYVYPGFKGNYKDSKKEGEWSEYDKNGVLIRTKIYKDGEWIK